MDGEEKEEALLVGQLVKHSPPIFVRPVRQLKQFDSEEQLVHPKTQLPALELLVSKWPGRGTHLDPFSYLKSRAEHERQLLFESQVRQSKGQA